MHALVLLARTVGFITLFRTLTSITRWIWVTFFRPPKNLREYGSWALVTGSTDGIGKALAFELASEGLNLILVGRNPTKLRATSQELLERNQTRGLQVKSLVIDFSSDPLEEIGSKIKRGIQRLDVGILINNVGISTIVPRFFHDQADSVLEELVKVNLESVCRVTRAVLPVMLKKKRGAIVNVGSGTVDVVSSFPFYSVYSATKAYVHQFSRSLHVEYKQHGIDVQCQVPFLVATKLVPIKFPAFIPTPEDYSKRCLRWIGYEPLCNP